MKERSFRLFVMFSLFFALVGVIALGVQFSRMPKASPALRITEVMSSNRGGVPATDGEFYDWLEVENTGSAPVELSQYSLSDDKQKPQKFVFQKMKLLPGEFAIVYCSKTDKPMHAGFRLSSSGETVYLFDQNANIVDEVTIPPLQANSVYALAGGAFLTTDTPTPGYPNTEDGYRTFVNTLNVEEKTIVINEIMPSNATVLPDDTGEYSDWLELHNRTDESIDLTGFGLTNNPNKPMKFQFPQVIIPPGGYIVVFASGSTVPPSDGDTVLHTSFKINSTRDEIILSDSIGRVMDRVVVQDIPANQSYGRSEADPESLEIQTQPTPGLPNTRGGAIHIERELRIANRSGLFIGKVNTSDNWVDLYNWGLETIQLGNYSLSDNSRRLSKLPVPEQLIPSGGSARIELGDAFGLSGYEVLYLSADNKVIDSIPLPWMPEGATYGRSKGRDGFFYLTDNGSYITIAEMPEFSLKGGAYPNAVKLSMALSYEPQSSLSATDVIVPSPPISNIFAPPSSILATRSYAQIRYTQDATDPNESSEIYSDTLNVPETGTIRARVYQEDCLPSPIYSQTYLIAENHSLPVVCLSTDPKNLWSDEMGIYVKGPNATENFPFGRDGSGANFWMDWERLAYVEYYDETGRQAISQNAGIKIHGQYSRAFEQKSLSLYARSSYGPDSFKCEVFDGGFSEYKTLLLRSTGQDYEFARMRDLVATSLVKDRSTLLHQDGFPIVVYINGQYWGHYNLRERINKYFIAAHNGWVNPDEISIIKGDIAQKGSRAPYAALLDFVDTADMTDAKNVNYVLSEIDIDSFLDWQIFQIYTANVDTGNIRLYRPKIPGEKWRWILYDLDQSCFANPGSALDFTNRDSFEYVLGGEGTGQNRMFENLLIRRLLENAEIRQLFFERFHYHMENTFAQERVIGIIDSLYTLMEPEMARHFDRWPKQSTSAKLWAEQVEYLRQFARERPKYIYAHLQNWFDLSDAEMRSYFGADYKAAAGMAQ